MSGSMSGMWKRGTVWIMRHRQTKGPDTDRPDLNNCATSRLYSLLAVTSRSTFTYAVVRVADKPSKRIASVSLWVQGHGPVGADLHAVITLCSKNHQFARELRGRPREVEPKSTLSYYFETE